MYLHEYTTVFEVPSSELSFVGTLSPGVFTLFGIFTGRLSDKVGPRPVVLFGMVVYVVALVAASFSQEVWHLYLTQGVLLGIGSSFAYFPVVSIVPTWVG